MTIDTTRLHMLMTEVEQITVEVPRLYRASRGRSGASLLETQKNVLQLLRQSAHALTEACAIASCDPATFTKLDALRTQTVEWLIEVTYKCMALEEAELMREAKGQTLH